ncbi:MAG: hypothetical protein ACRDWN_01490 [Acidimicrobiales bacterium]
MSTTAAIVRRPSVSPPRPTSPLRRIAAAWPTWGLISTKNLELRRRRGLMIAVFVLILGPPVLEYGIRLLFHVVDPSKFGPAGIPSAFQDLMSPMAELGFIMAVTVGAAAGTTDLTDGMFRHLVITGRSRIALFLARIPAGLGIVLPVVALAFTLCCLVTSFEGVPNPTAVSINNGVSVPVNLSQSQFHAWIDQHPREALEAFPRGPGTFIDGVSVASGSTASRYNAYTEIERTLNPSTNEMVKIGLWLELVVGVGFIVGLGFGALTGQRTVTTIVLIALQVIVTPIFDRAHIPYFINGQRLLVGVALDQLQPAGLASGAGGGGGGGPLHFGGGGGPAGIPPMPTWAMILVIVGWIVGWSVIGAWRMATRDA